MDPDIPSHGLRVHVPIVLPRRRQPVTLVRYDEAVRNTKPIEK